MVLTFHENKFVTTLETQEECFPFQRQLLILVFLYHDSNTTVLFQPCFVCFEGIVCFWQKDVAYFAMIVFN
jgi:hypothetical protein